MSKLKIAGATLALVLSTSGSAFAQNAEADAELMKTPSVEGIVTDAASCEYEGGSVMDLTDGKVCFIAIRGVAANTANYDGMRLGVMRCSGNGTFANEIVQPNGEYCRVYLGPKKKKKTRAELEAELEAMTEAELNATN